MPNPPCTKELHSRLSLYATPQIGPQRFYRLLKHFSSATNALHASAADWQQLGIAQQCHRLARSTQMQQQADAALHWAGHPDHHLLFHDSSDYPILLSEIQTAPPVLFVAGNLHALSSPQLAIVGSRNASPGNRQTARQFASALAAAGCTITSGLANGIDTAAHQGALQAGGCTLAVVGTGLKHTYPRCNRALHEQIVQSGGAVISEFFLDCKPLAANFPKRNRIISGLSLGVLVVEASLSSGSLITARHAVEQNRDVFAMPGSIHYPGSRGCHQLLREGAVLTECVQDIFSAWQGWLHPPVQQPLPEASPAIEPDPLLALLQNRPMGNEELAQLGGLAVSSLLQQLTLLELDGKIYSKDGLWHYLPPRRA